MTEIRFLNAGDSAEYWALRYEGLKLEPAAFGVSAEEFGATTPEEVGPRHLLNDPNGNFMVGAFVDGKLCGIMGFYRDTYLKRRHRGTVIAVYVSAVHRGKGLARGMMQTLIDRVRGYDDLEILSLGVVAEDGPARRLYQSFGFQKIGHERRALKLVNSYVDEDLMELDLRD